MSNFKYRIIQVFLAIAILTLGIGGVMLIKNNASQSEPADERTDNQPEPPSLPLPESLQPLADQCDTGDMAACYQLATQLVIDEAYEVDLQRARPYFEKVCLSGNLSACTDLGLTYEKGQTNEDPDEQIADKWYTYACDAGDENGCASLARRDNPDVPDRESLDQVIERLQTDCDADDFAACTELALYYTIGQGVPEDLSFAYNLYTKSCDGKFMLACYYLGSIYAEGTGVEKDLKQARKYYEMACKAGESKACNNLGSLIGDPAIENPDTKSAAKDLKRARELYQQACDAENYTGCHNLAVAYSKGHGVPVDPQRAKELFIHACDNGEGASCHSLALLYSNDETSTDNDSPETFAFYQKACELGHPPACHNLGMMYATGQTPQAEPDYEAARNALAGACESMHFPACYFLGLLIQNGQGGPADAQAAYELMQIACDGGEAAACDSL